MSDARTHLTRCLTLYGADISRWPHADQPAGIAALKTPALAALIEEERRFEEMMLTLGSPSPLPGFSERILLAARACMPRNTIRFWLQTALKDVSPAALVAMLALGFTLGFSLHPDGALRHGISPQQNSVDDEGTIL